MEVNAVSVLAAHNEITSTLGGDVSSMHAYCLALADLSHLEMISLVVSAAKSNLETGGAGRVLRAWVATQKRQMLNHSHNTPAPFAFIKMMNSGQFIELDAELTEQEEAGKHADADSMANKLVFVTDLANDVAACFQVSRHAPVRDLFSVFARLSHGLDHAFCSSTARGRAGFLCWLLTSKHPYLPFSENTQASGA